RSRSQSEIPSTPRSQLSPTPEAHVWWSWNWRPPASRSNIPTTIATSTSVPTAATSAWIRACTTPPSGTANIESAPTRGSSTIAVIQGTPRLPQHQDEDDADDRQAGDDREHVRAHQARLGLPQADGGIARRRHRGGDEA